MKQILLNTQGALVARVPRPAVQPGTVLVEVHYSLISTGTELASLRKSSGAMEDKGGGGNGTSLLRRLPGYVHKVVRNPDLAWERVKLIGTSRASSLRQRLFPPPAIDPTALAPAIVPADAVPVGAGGVALSWLAAQGEVIADHGKHRVQGRGRPGHYQASAQPLVPIPGCCLQLDLRGRTVEGAFDLGILSGDRTRWLAVTALDAGEFNVSLLVDTANESVVWPMLMLGGARESAAEPQLVIDSCNVRLVRIEPGISVNEMNDQGWNVGYSAAGRIVAVGEGVVGLKIDDLVACGGAGQANHAEVICVRRNLVAAVPRACPADLAAMTTVGAIAMQGVRRAEPRLGEICCVFGLGLLGLITCELLRANGCRVIGIDLEPERVQRARDLGVVHATTDIAEAIRIAQQITGGHGVDATLIMAATKSDSPANDAMKLTRRKGRVVIVGDIGLGLERAELYRKEIDVLISTSYGPGRYDPTYEMDGVDYPYAYVRWTQNRNMQAFLSLLGNGAIRLRSLVDEVVPLAAAPSTYARLVEGASGASIAVLIEYPSAQKASRTGTPEVEQSLISLRGHRAPKAGRLGYALVGAGAFGTSMLVPQMDRRSDRFDLRGIVSRDAVRGGNFARQRQVALLASDLDPVLEREDIDLVVITTRHDQHAQQAAAALRAGKHVFVEKPLALTWSELDLLREAYRNRPENNLLMVGFNRRFAPAAMQLRQRVATRLAPMIVNYRLNGGYIPLDNWIQRKEGGGRNLGEACHMYDFFRALTGAPIAAVSASAIDPQGSAYLSNDNFVATLTYADGSVCVLTYTANGPKADLPKERVEVFCDGKAYVLDNYERLVEYPGSTDLWYAQAADKGHFEELSQFGDAIAEGRDEGPIPYDEILESTAVALHIEDLLQGRI